MRIPKPKSEKPTRDFIEGLAESIPENFGKRDAIDEAELFPLYEQVNKIVVPEKLEADVVHSGYISDMIDHSAGLFRLEDPRFSQPEEKLGSQAEERSTTIEDFLSASMRMEEEQAGAPILWPYLKDVALYGRGGWVQLPNAHHLIGMPKRSQNASDDDIKRWKRERGLPLIWRRIPVNQREAYHEFKSCAYPFESDGGVRRFIYKHDVMIQDLLDRKARVRKGDSDTFGAFEEKAQWLFDNKQTTRAGLVELIEYFDDEWIGYLINIGSLSQTKEEQYMLTEVFPHGLGELPVVWTQGETPHSLSLAYHPRKLAGYFDQLLSQAATGIRLTNWPTGVIKVSKEAGGASASGRPNDIEVIPGEWLTLFTDEDAGWLIPNNTMGNDVKEQMAIVMRLLDRQSPSSGVMDTVSGDATGFAFNSRWEVAKVKLNPLKHEISKALEKDARLKLKIVELIGEPLELWQDPKDGSRKWFTIKPQDIRGYHNVRAEISAVPPQMLPAMVMVAERMRAPTPDGRPPLAPDAWIRDRLLDIGDNSRIEQQLALERFRAQPQVQALITLRAAQEADEEIARADLEALASQITIPQQLWPPALGEALAGIPSMPGASNIEGEMAAQEVPGTNVGSTGIPPKTTAGQAGFFRSPGGNKSPAAPVSV